MVSFPMTSSKANQGFTVTVLFKTEYLKTVHFRDKVTIGRK